VTKVLDHPFLGIDMKDIHELRKEYAKAVLDEKNSYDDPIQQFKQWFDEAQLAEIIEPNAMALATSSLGGAPSIRIVLLKGVENGQFLFFTNYQSKKGKQLFDNPACALNFFWPALERQIRIEGIAEQLSTEKSLTYFQSRPRGSQLGAWASPQSAAIKDRDILAQRLAEVSKRFENVEPLPKPEQWGGYAVTPYVLEFWQGRPNRLHDRLEYTQVEGGWKRVRLAP
jgi:pyridoxamine 5'-phosphate oxidase